MQALKQVALIATLFFCSVSFCQAQNPSFRPVEMIVFEMAEYNKYESQYVGFAATKSKQYNRFEELLATATSEQLLSLAADHQNAVVRVYAFKALRQRKAAISPALSEKFKADQSKVTMVMGCVHGTKTVSSLAAL